MGAIILQLFAHKRAHLHACVRRPLLNAYNDGGSVECEKDFVAYEYVYLLFLLLKFQN